MSIAGTSIPAVPPMTLIERVAQGPQRIRRSRDDRIIGGDRLGDIVDSQRAQHVVAARQRDAQNVGNFRRRGRTLRGGESCQEIERSVDYL
jgi:hypothetical protein